MDGEQLSYHDFNVVLEGGGKVHTLVLALPSRA